MRGLVLSLFVRQGRDGIHQHFHSSIDARGWRLEALDDGAWMVCAGSGEMADGDALLVTLPNGDELASPPTIDHRFGIVDVDFSLCQEVRIELRPNGDPGDPVERLMGMAMIALALIDDDALAVYWGGAHCLMGVDYFRRMASTWLAGGAFPALGLAALELDERGVMISVGLDLLVGQEVAVHPADDMGPPDQARLAIRFIDFLTREGPIHVSQPVEIANFGRVDVQIDENKGLLNLSR